MLEGLAVALANIDEFIRIIRESPTPPVAKAELMARSLGQPAGARDADPHARGVPSAPTTTPRGPGTPFGGYAGRRPVPPERHPGQEILQMRLQRLTGLEQDKIVAEYKTIMAEIEDLLDILAKPERVIHHHRRRVERRQTRSSGKTRARRSEIEHNARLPPKT